MPLEAGTLSVPPERLGARVLLSMFNVAAMLNFLLVRVPDLSQMSSRSAFLLQFLTLCQWLGFRRVKPKSRKLRAARQRKSGRKNTRGRSQAGIRI